VTLLASWDSDGFVHYSLSTLQTTVAIASINVPNFAHYENIIRKFYAGNAIAGMGFPFGHYVYYFQFGVVSSGMIADSHWSVDLREPRIMRDSGWSLVDTAWSTQGDISYLDYDWKWGGAPYEGVSAEYLNHPFESPYEVVFFYDGETLPRGTILWKPLDHESTVVHSDLIYLMDNISYPLAIVLTVTIIIIVDTELRRRVRNTRPSAFP
jgi:hypothetical protein